METCKNARPQTEQVPHPQLTPGGKARAVKEWRALADELEREAELGIIHPATAKYNADLYRRTARSIEIEIETGIAVCVCCFKPFGRGAFQL